jgi:hypothetical protein
MDWTISAIDRRSFISGSVFVRFVRRPAAAASLAVAWTIASAAVTVGLTMSSFWRTAVSDKRMLLEFFMRKACVR